MCGPGIGGALPLVQGIDSCCAGRSDSPYCVEVCRIIRTSDTVSMLVPGCSML
jgi:hypothetical protein